MKIDPRELWREFKSALNPGDTIETNRVAILLRSTVTSLRVTIKSIDKFLATYKDRVKDLVTSLPTKGQEIVSKGRVAISNFFNRDKDSVTETPPTSIFTKLREKFSGSTEASTGPPDSPESSIRDSKSGILANPLRISIEALTGAINRFTSISLPTINTESSLNIPNPLKGIFSRSDKRKIEVENEKRAVQLELEEKKKLDKKDSWLSKILAGIGNLGGFLLNGIGSAISGLGGLLLKFLPGVSKLGLAATAGLSKLSAKAASSVVGKGVAVTAGLAKPALLTAGRVGLKALTFVGRAALGVATGPIGLGVTAATAAYYGYNYLTRNSIDDDIYGKLTRYRFLSYGFNDVKKEHYHKLFDLEDLHKSYTKSSGRGVELKRLSNEDIVRVAEIFDVDTSDKESYAILNNWYTNRFIPAYRSFMHAVYSVNPNITLENINRIKGRGMESFLVNLRTPNSIFAVEHVPTFPDTKIYVKVDDIVAMKTSIARLVYKRDPIPTETKVAIENRKAIVNNTAIDSNNVTPKPVVTHTTPKKFEDIPSPDQEGEVEKRSTPTRENLSSKVNNKLSTATGDLVPGSTDLTGIATKLDKTAILNLDPNVRELFTGMAKEYNTLTGKSLTVNDGFRSFKEQEALFRKYPNKAARPGNSLHEYGLAIDVNSSEVRELDKLGLLRKYGFTTSIGQEPWHLEPIGVSMDPAQSKADPSFRFSAIQSSIGRGGGGYGLDPKSILKKRNIEMQKAIYSSSSSTPIDNITNDTTEVPTTATSLSEKIQNTPIIPTSTESKGIANVTSITNEPSLIPKESVTPTTNTNLNVSATTGNIDPVTAIKQAASMTGTNPETMMTIAKVESSLNPKAGATTSSAKGLFQFTNDTWKDILRSKGAKYGLDESTDIFNPLANSLMGGEFINQNLARLSNTKPPDVNEDTAVYLNHFLGSSGAKTLFTNYNKDPNTPIQNAVSTGAFRANRDMMTKASTAGGLIQLADNKLDKARSTPVNNYLRGRVDTSNTPDEDIRSSNPSITNQLSEPPVFTPKEKTPVSISAIDVTRVNTPKPTPIETPQQDLRNTLSLSKTEGLLSEQLTTLTQIASILSTISDKVDMSKLSELIKERSTTNPNTNDPLIRTNKENTEFTSVSLSRRNIQA